MHGITKFSRTHTGNFIFDLKSRVNEQLVKSTSLPKFPPLLPTYSAPQLLSFGPPVPGTTKVSTNHTTVPDKEYTQ